MCVLTRVSVWKGRMAVQGEADTTTSRCLLHKHPGGNYFTTFISHTCFSGRGTSVVAMHQLPRSQTLPHAHIYVRTRIHKHTRKYERSSKHTVHMRVHPHTQNLKGTLKSNLRRRLSTLAPVVPNHRPRSAHVCLRFLAAHDDTKRRERVRSGMTVIRVAIISDTRITVTP